MTIKPIIIIGAPRSGTNMLRDTLTMLPNVDTWPCDEINYIWRHGNIRFPSDEFTSDMARPKVIKYIQKKFGSLARAKKADTIIEKTCANSLRINFVNRVLPEAKYIFIVRDGMDVVGSAMQRWTAALDIPYLFKKTRFVPATDLPYYAARYLCNRFYRLFSDESRLALWGPSISNAADLLAQRTLSEVCALQWKACVEKAENSLSAIPPDRIIRVRYEEFVTNPAEEFLKLATFANKELTSSIKAQLTTNISSHSVGKGRATLGKHGLERLHPLIGSALRRYHYEC